MKNIKINLNLALTLIFVYLGILLLNNLNYFTTFINKFLILSSPFIIGFIIAYMVNPILNFFEKKLKLKRLIATILIYLLFLILMISMLKFILPPLSTNLSELASNLPEYISKMSSFVINLGKKLNIINNANMEKYTSKIAEYLPTINAIFSNSLQIILNKTFSAGKFFAAFFMGIIVSFYFLLSKESCFNIIKKSTNVFLGKKQTNLLTVFFRDIHNNIGRYFAGKVLDNIIIGILACIGLSLLNSQYAVLFGILFAICNFIPYVGAFISLSLIFVINVFVSIPIAIQCIIFMLVLQQIEASFIDPKIVGNMLGLPPLLSIFSVIISGGFFGILGMILAPPITSLLKTYYLRFLNIKEDELNNKNKNKNKKFFTDTMLHPEKNDK